MLPVNYLLKTKKMKLTVITHLKKERTNVELAYVHSNLLSCWTISGCMLLHVKKQENLMYVSCQIATKITHHRPSAKMGHVAAVRERSHQWCVFLTPKNTKNIQRMTGHCFLRPIRRDLRSYQQLLLYPQKWLLD